SGVPASEPASLKAGPVAIYSFLLHLPLLKSAHASVRYRTEGLRPVGRSGCAGAERNIRRGSAAAFREWRTALPGQEHIRWEASRIAGIPNAATASRARGRTGIRRGRGQVETYSGL